MTQQQGRVVLVIGATGQQGGAVVEALLAAGGWRLRALTRQLDGEKAHVLKARGVEVVPGDMNDTASLMAAMTGVTGVFSVQSAAGQSVEDEVRQGKNVAEVAKQARVSHLVFTSVCGAERKTDVPHFESKGVIEAHIRALGIPHTILRPVSFMENFNRNREAIFQGRFTGLLSPNSKNWFIAVRDIGAFAAAAFTRPDQFLGQAINIAGEELTMTQTAETFGRVVGRPVAYSQIPREEAQRRVPGEMLAMNDWFEREGYRVDVPALRSRWGIPLLRLEEWLRQAGWAAKSS